MVGVEGKVGEGNGKEDWEDEGEEREAAVGKGHGGRVWKERQLGDSPYGRYAEPDDEDG